MSNDGVGSEAPPVALSRARSALVSKALSEAARRARFSSRRRGLTATGFRARRRDRLFRTLRIIAFLGMLVLPIGIGGLYFGLVASDQYVAEARFTVRGGTPPTIDRIGSLTGAPSMLIVQDTQVVMNYLQSRAVVEVLDREVALRSLYERDDVDWFSRLGHDRPIEKVVKYWKRQTDLTVQLPSGIVVFTVRAFSPQDAVKLADAALESSEQLVNRMNDQMRRDAVALAERERRRAQEKLVQARAGLERARNQEGMLSAEVASKALSELTTEVKGTIIKRQQDYETQLRFVSADAPQMKTLLARIVASQAELKALDAQVTAVKEGAIDKSEARVLSGSMSRLDYASLENTIAEKMYAGSLTALEHAKLASEAKLMYINTFVRPTAAQEAKYPRRLLDIALVAAASLAAWSAVAALLALARARLA